MRLERIRKIINTAGLTPKLKMPLDLDKIERAIIVLADFFKEKQR